jgi:CRISPR/Cas system-associated exonuclease Cas4 (RecB family)
MLPDLSQWVVVLRREVPPHCLWLAGTIVALGFIAWLILPAVLRMRHVQGENTALSPTIPPVEPQRAPALTPAFTSASSNSPGADPALLDVRPERPGEVSQEVSVEADLSAHGLPKLVGVLDLVRPDGRIVDFKTSGKTPDPEQVAHTTEGQTTAYSLLYREATGGVESGVEIHTLVKTKAPKLIVTALPPATDAQVTRLFRGIESYVAGLEREDFVPSPGLQCASCEFYGECRRWS